MPLQISERVLFSLQRLHEGGHKARFVSTSHEWLWKLEYCRLFWARSEHRTALQMLRQLTDQLDKVRQYIMEKNFLGVATLNLYCSLTDVKLIFCRI